jgi:hypothetical protein
VCLGCCFPGIHQEPVSCYYYFVNTEAKEAVTRLVALIEAFERRLFSDDIRPNVIALIPVFKQLQDVGKTLIPDGLRLSARDRIISYFLRYPGIVISGDELMIVSGISEWARRVRELRVQFGWAIISGVTVSEAEIDEPESGDPDLLHMGPDDYMLLSIEQDMEAAYRWNVANEIRKRGGSMKDKLLVFLRINVGKPLSGEELRYVAEGSEWARRIRELRTEEGWPIATRTSGRPDLPVGIYLLERDAQTHTHDRRIPDAVRGAVLQRDHFACVKCFWNHGLWSRADPRFLELHHVVHHVDGGSNSAVNLITLCNVCHDEAHKLDKNA